MEKQINVSLYPSFEILYWEGLWVLIWTKKEEVLLSVTGVCHECLWCECVSVCLSMYWEMRPCVSLRSLCLQYCHTSKMTVLLYWKYWGSLIHNFIHLEFQGAPNSQTTLKKKNKVGGLTFPNFKPFTKLQSSKHDAGIRIDICINGILLEKCTGAERQEKEADNSSITSRIY